MTGDDTGNKWLQGRRLNPCDDRESREELYPHFSPDNQPPPSATIPTKDYLQNVCGGTKPRDVLTDPVGLRASYGWWANDGFGDLLAIVLDIERVDPKTLQDPKSIEIARYDAADHRIHRVTPKTFLDEYLSGNNPYKLFKAVPPADWDTFKITPKIFMSYARLRLGSKETMIGEDGNTRVLRLVLERAIVLDMVDAATAVTAVQNKLNVPDIGQVDVAEKLASLTEIDIIAAISAYNRSLFPSPIQRVESFGPDLSALYSLKK